MNPKTKPLTGRNSVKVDGVLASSPRAQVDQEGMVVAISCQIPSRTFGPDKERKSGDPILPDKLRKSGDPVIETTTCEVEVFFRNNGRQQVWKGSAEREFRNGATGVRESRNGTAGNGAGKLLLAWVLLKDLDPPVSYETLNPEFARG